MLPVFTRSVLRRSGHSGKNVCEFLQTSPVTVSWLRFAHTVNLPSTTTVSRSFHNINGIGRSNGSAHSRRNGGSIVFIAASVTIIGWVVSSTAVPIHLDSENAQSTSSSAFDKGNVDNEDPVSDSRSDSSEYADVNSRSSRPRKSNVKAALPYSEVQRHTNADSCWIIIDGQVYDVTSILDTHPGGRRVLLNNSGKDATKAFIPIHPPGTLSTLPPEAHVGPVDPATLPKAAPDLTPEEQRIKEARSRLPPPEAALNLQDIERLAESVLTSTAWAYYRSAGDDERTYDENISAFRRYWFRPRVLNRISQLTTSTTMIGLPCSLPIFVAPAALARLGHPDGEMNLTRAASEENIVMCLSNNSSCSIGEVMSIRSPEQSIFFQLYMNRDRKASEKLIRSLAQKGFKAVILTVDAAVPGKRERDQRAKGDFAGPSHGKSSTGAGLGVAHAISGYQDPDVCWDDIPWIRSLTDLPLIIKGIQCIEDAAKSFEVGAKAIILSNHGGRELDFSPSPMTVLHEIRIHKPDLLEREIYVDGGVTRGTDVVKAICLGARAVGLGRAFLYGNGVWGEAGVRRVVQIMREEIETAMRLLGVTSIDQLKPELLRYSGPDLLAKL